MVIWYLGVCVIYTIYTGGGSVSWCLCDLYYLYGRGGGGGCVGGLVSWCLCDLYYLYGRGGG